MGERKSQNNKKISFGGGIAGNDITAISGGVGFSAFLATMFCLYYFTPPASDDYLLSLVYRVCLAASQIITLFVSGFLIKKSSKLEGGIAFFSFWLGPVALLLTVCLPSDLTEWICILLIIQGVCLSHLAATWFWVICDYENVSTPFQVASASLLALLVVLFMIIFPEQLRGIVMVAVWFLSSAAISLLRSGALANAEELFKKLDGEEGWTKNIPATATIMLASQYLVIGYVVGLVSGQPIPLQLICGILPALGLLIQAIDAASKRVITERNLYKPTPGILITSLIFPCLLSSADTVLAVVCLSVSLTLTAIYIVFGWSALAKHTVNAGAFGVRVFSKSRTIDYAALVLGLFLGVISYSYGGSNPYLWHCIVISLGSAYALISGFCHFPNYPESRYNENRKSEAPDIRGQWKRRCTLLSERYMLTDRQYDVLLLISQGRNAEYVASTLSISVSTVQTHIRHIYQKTGVHTRQELIDLIEHTKISGEI